MEFTLPPVAGQGGKTEGAQDIEGNANGIVTQTANAGGSQGHVVTLAFPNESSPPISIIGYGLNPASGNYNVLHYDRDNSQITYNVGIANLTQQSVVNGGSGSQFQWSGDAFTSAGTYSITLPVGSEALLYGSGGKGVRAGLVANHDADPHAYIVIVAVEYLEYHSLYIVKYSFFKSY